MRCVPVSVYNASAIPRLRSLAVLCCKMVHMSGKNYVVQCHVGQGSGVNGVKGKCGLSSEMKIIYLGSNYLTMHLSVHFFN